MDLQRIRHLALSRISDRTWRHTISLTPKLADAAQTADTLADAAADALAAYHDLPPEAKTMDVRGSGNEKLKQLEAEAATTRKAADEAKAAADEASIYLEFKILTPDEYTAKLLPRSDSTGKFDLEPFTLDLLAATYVGAFTGPGREGETGEDVGITWAEIHSGATAVITHGEQQELCARVIEENRRIDSFPS